MNKCFRKYNGRDQGDTDYAHNNNKNNNNHNNNNNNNNVSENTMEGTKGTQTMRIITTQQSPTHPRYFFYY